MASLAYNYSVAYLLIKDLEAAERPEHVEPTRVRVRNTSALRAVNEVVRGLVASGTIASKRDVRVVEATVVV